MYKNVLEMNVEGVELSNLNASWLSFFLLYSRLLCLLLYWNTGLFHSVKDLCTFASEIFAGSSTPLRRASQYGNAANDSSNGFYYRRVSGTINIKLFYSWANIKFN